MPYKRYVRKTYTKKKFARSKPVARFTKRYSGPGRSIMPYAPATRLVKMNYVGTASINSASGVPAYHVLRANSINDPDETGIGHQPMYHDEMAVLYNHYLVKSCNIIATFHFENTTNTAYMPIVGILLDDDGAVNLTTTAIMESPGFARWRHLSMNNSNSRAIATVKHYFNASKFFGIKDPNGLDSIGAGFGSNPVDLAKFGLFVAPVNETDELPPVTVEFKMQFVVLCSERMDPIQS